VGHHISAEECSGNQDQLTEGGTRESVPRVGCWGTSIGGYCHSDREWLGKPGVVGRQEVGCGGQPGQYERASTRRKGFGCRPSLGDRGGHAHQGNGRGPRPTVRYSVGVGRGGQKRRVPGNLYVTKAKWDVQGCRTVYCIICLRSREKCSCMGVYAMDGGMDAWMVRTVQMRGICAAMT
jgi:hypothetical protein